MADAGKAICRHISLLSSARPRGEGGVRSRGKGLLASGGAASPAALGVGVGVEAELGMPELSRVGLEVRDIQRGGEERGRRVWW